MVVLQAVALPDQLLVERQPVEPINRFFGTGNHITDSEHWASRDVTCKVGCLDSDATALGDDVISHARWRVFRLQSFQILMELGLSTAAVSSPQQGCVHPVKKTPFFVFVLEPPGAIR